MTEAATHQPQPEVLRASGKTPLEELFALSIDNFELRKGEFAWDERRIPLDFTAHDVSADMTYSLLEKKYDGKLLLGKADTNFDGYRPIAWTAEAHFSLAQTSLELKSISATSGRSRLQASGRIDDFSNPKIIANYQASIDLAEAAAVARRPEVRRGILQLEGNRKWEMGETGWSDFGSRKLLFGSPSTSVPTGTMTRPSSASVTKTQA